VLLHGQAGTGKTSLVEALANDAGYELVETNASDTRTKKKLKSELKEATRQKSFFGGQKLILVDEVDGMAGNADRGGAAELKRIIEESRFPVVMTANDNYEDSIRSLRRISKQVELKSVHTNSINAHLKQILESEGIEYEKKAVKKIARRAGGQMRSAINDLEAVARGSEMLTEEDVEVLGSRDKEQEVFDALKMVFKTTTPSTAARATDNLDEDPGTWLEWVRENLPREYERSGDRSRGFDAVSRADLFNGRIRRRMNWKLLKYVYRFSTAGVALAKEEKYDGWTKYQYPTKIRKMGQSRAARNKLESIGGKIGEKLHVSTATARSELPFLAAIIEKEPEVAEQLDLEEEEVEFVRKFSSA
jgi:replication factor C large subunit